MTFHNPSSGTGKVLTSKRLEFARLLMSLNPDDKRDIARIAEERARKAEGPESANCLYRLADLMRAAAASDERAIKALGLQPGEGLE